MIRQNREDLELQSKTLSQEEQVALIKSFVQEIATNEKLECKDVHYKILKGKPLHISAKMQQKKDVDNFKRAQVEGKYLADLLSNSNLLNEEDASSVSRCLFHNGFTFTKFSFLSNCRRKMKKMCATYGIEYDLLQFKKSTSLAIKEVCNV